MQSVYRSIVISRSFGVADTFAWIAHIGTDPCFTHGRAHRPTEREPKRTAIACADCQPYRFADFSSDQSTD